MKSLKSFRLVLVTLVTVAILTLFGLVIVPKSVMAQTPATSPLNDLIKPFEAFKDALTNKVPQLGSTENANRIKGFFERNGINYDSIGNMLNNVVNWFKGLMNSTNSPAFIAWAVDIIKRIFLLLLEIVNKIVSYL